VGEKFDRQAAVEQVRQYLAIPIEVGVFKDGYERESNEEREHELQQIACRRIEALTDEQMPAVLRRYLRELLIDTKPRLYRHRGTGRPSTEVRDITVWDAVRYAAAEFNLNPTRNDATGRVECGCSIVAAALGMRESEVKRVYLRHYKASGWERRVRELAHRAAAQGIKKREVKRLIADMYIEMHRRRVSGY
jgi:hypothetical protein